LVEAKLRCNAKSWVANQEKCQHSFAGKESPPEGSERGKKDCRAIIQQADNKLGGN